MQDEQVVRRVLQLKTGYKEVKEKKKSLNESGKEYDELAKTSKPEDGQVLINMALANAGAISRCAPSLPPSLLQQLTILSLLMQVQRSQPCSYSKQ